MTNNYLNTIYAEGCNNLINKPTRITQTTATLLDHIYSDMTKYISYTGILMYDVSDHLPNYCIKTK